MDVKYPVMPIFKKPVEKESPDLHTCPNPVNVPVVQYLDEVTKYPPESQHWNLTPQFQAISSGISGSTKHT